MKPTGNAQAATFDFLQPPRAADEMGRLGPYRILRVVGVGSMGVVFLAEDTRSWRQVALKALKPNVANADKARQRFLREGQATADLKHDHVVTIHEVGQAGDVPYLAMEYLQGESLDARLKRESRLAIAELLRVGRETAAGLAAAHGHGLIHRDVKPSNLWLEGKRRRVKVLDFGLARQTGADQTNLTQAGVIIGTPSYMSPEQAKGEAVDARADLFSLGCVLYRMCVGEAPFRGKDTVSTLRALAMEAPAPPVERRPDVPAELKDLILRLLSKEPDRRPPTAEAVVQAITAIEQRLPNAPAPRPSRPVVPVRNSAQAENTELAVDLPAATRRRRPRRQRGPVVLVLGGAALVVLGLLLVVVLLARPVDGFVRLDAEESDLEIALLDRGREAAVLDRKSKEVRLKPGEYEVEIRRARDGWRLPTERVMVERGGHAVVRATREVLGIPMGSGALVASPPLLPNLESWTLETREHRGPITALALSGDGKWLATGGEDGTVRVWSYPEAELTRVLVVHGVPVVGLAWSPDNKTLTSFDANKKAYLWDLSDSKYAKHGGVETAAPETAPPSFKTPDGNLLSLVGGRVLLRDGRTLKESAVLCQPRPRPIPISALAAAPAGKVMASIHADSSIRVWEANSGKLLCCLKAGDMPKPLLAWSPDGKTLATCHAPIVRFWDVATGTEANSVLSGPVNALAWAPDGKTLALLGTRLQLWDAESGQLRPVAGMAGGGAVAWSNDGKAVIVGAGNDVQVWDLNPDKARPKCERPANAGAVAGVALSPDGKAVAEAGPTGTRIYDPKTGKLLQTIPHLVPEPVLTPGWSPDGKTFVCGSAGKAALHDTVTYKSARGLPGTCTGPYAWSLDSRTLVLAQDGNLRLFAAAEPGRPPRGVLLAPGTDQAVFVLATGHYRSAAGDNEMVYVTQSDRGQQTLTPAEFAKAHGWKNDPRWVRFTDG